MRVEIDKLHAELERIATNDFFNAALRAAAFSAYERCQKAIRAAQGPTGKAGLSQKNEEHSTSLSTRHSAGSHARICILIGWRLPG